VEGEVAMQAAGVLLSAVLIWRDAQLYRLLQPIA
jgi:hypothetical protein